ncbi:Protein of unknown function [Halobacillus karajensis]|uniref:DUF3813 domain-containing protein n=1 Tax=Halobacillus karajensis TaxID=195088 RepID=A0A024P7R8_9BACI|nr:DUF3813 domain-containing protein [Halobacillus karajensis]CDQ21048.1 hypothetical protein BN982_03411 [Halobacillus karajensis]CDQ24888.1 hypothetical protein BN983_03187 [Halobacillus karajensis]CDQ28752.1 hypothetical protein BN981_03067 [Halobacillus karajensis]SEH96955.1 Protein of unknown function [Halobacillus karajensis]
MEKNLFENAREAVNRLTQNRGGKHNATSQEDMKAAKQAIQSAYSQCSQEEKQQLQQLEQEVEAHHNNFQ